MIAFIGLHITSGLLLFCVYLYACFALKSADERELLKHDVKNNFIIFSRHD